MELELHVTAAGLETVISAAGWSWCLPLVTQIHAERLFLIKHANNFKLRKVCVEDDRKWWENYLHHTASEQKRALWVTAFFLLSRHDSFKYCIFQGCQPLLSCRSPPKDLAQLFSLNLWDKPLQLVCLNFETTTLKSYKILQKEKKKKLVVCHFLSIFLMSTMFLFLGIKSSALRMMVRELFVICCPQVVR